MLNRLDASAILFTVNAAQIAKFYEEVVGLRVAKVEDDHIVLESGSFRLVVHRIPESYAQEIRITAPPSVREAGAIKLSFPVGSIAKAREIAATLGGCVYGPEREWSYDSTIVCDGWDSDGNVFQLFQQKALRE